MIQEFESLPKKKKRLIVIVKLRSKIKIKEYAFITQRKTRVFVVVVVVFSGQFCSMWKLPGQGSNPCQSSHQATAATMPDPQPTEPPGNSIITLKNKRTPRKPQMV